MTGRQDEDRELGEERVVGDETLRAAAKIGYFISIIDHTLQVKSDVMPQCPNNP
jgi:hypothetical protein